MDVHSNAAAAASGNQADDFLPSETPEGGVSLEWLSIFVEDCLNGGFPTPTHQPPNPSQAQQPQAPAQHGPTPAQAASKATRAKRRRALHPRDRDSQLLPQAHWLAESQPLAIPKREEGEGGRRCEHCKANKTPQWRAGPGGPKTLCNACGVRYKSGRLLPEYRPAKSPTFERFRHSNSHKKVMEIRMTSPLLPSLPSP